MGKLPAGDSDGKVGAWVTLTERIVVILRDPMTLPAAFMAFVCYLGWVWVPPVVNGHVNLLKETGATLQSMDDTLMQSNKILEKLATQSYPSEDFRQDIHDEHARAESILVDSAAKIDDIHKAVVK